METGQHELATAPPPPHNPIVTSCEYSRPFPILIATFGAREPALSAGTSPGDGVVLVHPNIPPHVSP